MITYIYSLSRKMRIIYIIQFNFPMNSIYIPRIRFYS